MTVYNMYNVAVLFMLLACLTGSVLCTPVVTNVIFRHGDRAPISPLPIDKYNVSFWPYGWGELTDLGETQQYRLGQFLKKRYTPLLEDRFDYKKIEVKSSNINRCLISAYSTLAGLYSNSTEKKDLQLPFMRWQPIPVQREPLELDEVLAMKRPCDLVTSEKRHIMNGKIVRKLNMDYADFFLMLHDKTGVDLTENGFRDMRRITDTLLCESIHFGSLPDWTSATNVSCNNNTHIPCKDRTVWKIMTQMSNYQLFLIYSSTVVHKFRGGPLLMDIVGKFEEYVAGDRTVTFNMFSAHGSTVAAVLSALGVFVLEEPDYTATVMIELHKANTVTDDYVVKVFYKSITDNTTVNTEMPILGCQSNCKLSTVRKLLEKYIISDWDSECGNIAPTNSTTTPTPKPGPNSAIIILAVCCSVEFIMIIIILIYCIRRRRLPKDYVNTPE